MAEEEERMSVDQWQVWFENFVSRVKRNNTRISELSLRIQPYLQRELISENDYHKISEDYEIVKSEFAAIIKAQDKLDDFPGDFDFPVIMSVITEMVCTLDSHSRIFGRLKTSIRKLRSVVVRNMPGKSSQNRDDDEDGPHTSKRFRT